MSQANERRARELVTEWMESEGRGLALSILIRKALDEAEARGRTQWRPVSEEPPDVPSGWAPFLCYSPGENIRVCWYSTSNGFQWSGPSTEAVITHWMPLPEPPTPTT